MEQTTETMQQDIRPTTDTSADQTLKEPKKDSGITVPLPITRWICYIIFFTGLLSPFIKYLNIAQLIGIAAILAHFAGQLNKLIDK